MALALLPIAAMHVLFGIPDGSCRLSRLVVGGGYVVGRGAGFRPLGAAPVTAAVACRDEAVLAVASVRASLSAGTRVRRASSASDAVVRVGRAVAVETLLVALALRVLLGLAHTGRPGADGALLPFAAAVAMCSTRRFAARIDRILTHTVSIAGLTGVVAAVYWSSSPASATPRAARNGRCWCCRWCPRRSPPFFTARPASARPLRQPPRLRRTRGTRRRAAHLREPAVPRHTHGRAAPAGGRVPAKDTGAQRAEVWTGSGGHLQRSVSSPDSPARASCSNRRGIRSRPGRA